MARVLRRMLVLFALVLTVYLDAFWSYSRATTIASIFRKHMNMNVLRVSTSVNTENRFIANIHCDQSNCRIDSR